MSEQALNSELLPVARASDSNGSPADPKTVRLEVMTADNIAASISAATRFLPVVLHLIDILSKLPPIERNSFLDTVAQALPDTAPQIERLRAA